MKSLFPFVLFCFNLQEVVIRAGRGVLQVIFSFKRDSFFVLTATELIPKRRLSGALLGKLFQRGLQDLANER